jgi:hypothetical protein
LASKLHHRRGIPLEDLSFADVARCRVEALVMHLALDAVAGDIRLACRGRETGAAILARQSQANGVLSLAGSVNCEIPTPKSNAANRKAALGRATMAAGALPIVAMLAEAPSFARQAHHIRIGCGERCHGGAIGQDRQSEFRTLSQIISW